jgi:hypothetical protein
MDADPPQRGDRRSPDRRPAGRALWCAGAGVAAVLAVAIAAALGDITVKLTIILGLPAVVLTLGGVTMALARDPQIAERKGFRAGFIASSLRERWRSLPSRRPKRRP